MILVTGGAGYIGSQFVRSCLLTGEDSRIVVIDDLSTGHRESLPESTRVHFYEACLSDRDVLDDIFSSHDISAVVHFAGKALVGEGQEKPFYYYDENVRKQLRLFQSMEEHGVRRIVFSSSCAVYGVPEYIPLDEKHPAGPVSVYGTCKKILEDVLFSLCLSRDWSCVSLRYFNAAGADAGTVMGEVHDPETHLIPNVLKAAKKDELTVYINGDDYDTADGSCVRDYIHVEDLAVAHKLALDLVRAEKVREAFNLGSDTGYSNFEIVRACQKITGKKFETVIRDRRPGDVSALVANSARAREKLGWSPRRDLNDIIDSAWRWEQSLEFDAGRGLAGEDSRKAAAEVSE